MKKFKVNFENIHNALLRNIDGKDFLIVEIPSLSGRERIWLQDGDEIQATDQLMEIALSGYECPKLPVTRISKAQKVQYVQDMEVGIKKGKNLKELPQLIAQPMFYDVADVRGKKPFEEVKK